jgi:glycerol-3-phosphate dehydrogenase
MAFNSPKSNSSAKAPIPVAGKTRRCDIAIIGGGIVGKACALGLAQQGFDVVQIAADLDRPTSKPSEGKWA